MSALTVAGTAPAASGGEGIKVHGNWRISTLDEEGRVLRQERFTNDLTQNGARLLVKLLTRQELVAADTDGKPLWGISVTTSGVSTSTECEALTGDFGVTEGEPMVAAVSNTQTTFSLSRLMTLPATCVTGATYNITEVHSGYSRTSGFSVTGNTEASLSGAFSAKTLASPYSVQPGQPVLLEVTFSFD